MNFEASFQLDFEGEQKVEEFYFIYFTFTEKTEVNSYCM